MRLPERVRLDLATSTRFGDIHLLDEVDSTNRVVADAAAAGAGEGLVVVADHQTAGRGRLGRRWEAPAGAALLVSVLLRPAGSPHLATAAAGLAAADACRLVAGLEPELKWPNDLLLGDRKLAGILASRLDDGAVVVGAGVNVASAPAGAASLGEGVERVELLVAFLRGLEARCARWGEVAGEYRERLATIGRRVRVEGPAGRVLVGRAVDVDGDGRLLVAPEAGALEADAEAGALEAGALEAGALEAGALEAGGWEAGGWEAGGPGGSAGGALAGAAPGAAPAGGASAGRVVAVSAGDVVHLRSAEGPEPAAW